MYHRKYREPSPTEVATAAGMGCAAYLSLYVGILVFSCLAIIGIMVAYCAGGVAFFATVAEVQEAQTNQQIEVLEAMAEARNPRRETTKRREPIAVSQSTTPAEQPDEKEDESPVVAQLGNWRKFGDKTGKHSVEAEYVRFVVDNSRVILRRRDGTEIDMSFHDLSDDDKEWVRAENRRRADERKAGEKQRKSS